MCVAIQLFSLTLFFFRDPLKEMPKNKKAGRSPTETPLAKIARIDPGKRITNEFYEKFFVGGKLSAIQVQCFVCGEVRSTCGNTTNAKVHVITNHLDVITDFLQSGKRVNQFDVEKHDSFKNLPASRPAPVAEMVYISCGLKY